jgi:pimeloyl-ACP methyl ester carboxylesterase
MPRTATIAGFESRFAQVGDVKLHYWLGGDPAGQPVLLWHGFLSTGYAWRKVAAALVEAGLSVLVPDMRGYGDSDKPAGVEGYDTRALAEEFRALVGVLGFGGGRSMLVAGHDMGGPPALLWAADHPAEILGLLYIEAPVMLSQVLQKVITYTPEAMAQGSMWWWVLPLAPEVPERLVVGHERAFLTWFFDRHTAHRESIEPETIDEYLRTFSGREGVLGAMGVYRAAFTSIAQTDPLMVAKVRTPVLAMGGIKGLGAKVGQGVSLVAENVEAHTLTDCGHFLPEERPHEIVEQIVAMARRG